MRSTFLPRLALKVANYMKKIKNYQIEMEFALPALFTVIASFIATIFLFCVSVQIANELLR